MSRIEYVNISGLRVDGRRPKETRRFRAALGLFPRADGSALVEQGGTKVVAVVHGPREAGRRVEHDAVALTAEFM
jgi:exosome complex component RRP41